MGYTSDVSAGNISCRYEEIADLTNCSELSTKRLMSPDFFSPGGINPRVFIEAKITGDDGTARDKVARVLRLASMRDHRQRASQPGFRAVACIDRRGFGVRRKDMRDLIIALEARFSPQTLCRTWSSGPTSPNFGHGGNTFRGPTRAGYAAQLRRN